jgi:hypothetical protein
MKTGMAANLPGKRKDELRRGGLLTREELLAAFPRASPAERRYLEALPASEDLRYLQSGFGDELRELFASVDRPSLEAWITNEVPREERFELIDSILGRI